MCNTLKVEYKFRAWQILFKKEPFDLNIFLSHMKYGRKIKKSMHSHKRNKLLCRSYKEESSNLRTPMLRSFLTKSKKTSVYYMNVEYERKVFIHRRLISFITS